MRDVTKMKELLKQRKNCEDIFDVTDDTIGVIEKEYLTSCGGTISVPSEHQRVLEEKTILVGFDWDGDLCIKQIGDCYNRDVYVPKELVDKFFKLIANTKSQRDVVLKGIENLRNEEAED